jgi:hypothetical protein
MEPAKPDPPRELLAANALIVGSAKGVIAGTFLGALAVIAALSPGAGFSLADAGRFAIGLALALGCLCGVEAASTRLEGRARILARFAAGFLVPFGAFAPQAGILDVAAGQLGQGANLARVLASLTIAGLALGFAEVYLGEPGTDPHEAQGCRRLLIMSAWLVVAAAVGTTIETISLSVGFWVLLGGVFWGTAVPGLLWLAQQPAALIVRPLARWLEPQVDIDRFAPKPSLDQIERAARSALAAKSDDLQEKHRLLAEALARLDGVGKLDAALARFPEARLEQLRAELLLALGELDAVEKLLPRVEDPNPLRLELARERARRR